MKVGRYLKILYHRVTRYIVAGYTALWLGYSLTFSSSVLWELCPRPSPGKGHPELMGDTYPWIFGHRVAVSRGTVLGSPMVSQE